MGNDSNNITFDEYTLAKDEYFDEEAVINRLLEEWEKYGKLIVAYDFDNTVYDLYKNGSTYDQLIELLKTCKQMGCVMIVFTCRPIEEYEIVENYLKENDIPFDYINENDPSIEFNTSRKIFYNIFFDDRAGLKYTYELMVRTIEKRLER